jgi:hypothetical protein
MIIFLKTIYNFFHNYWTVLTPIAIFIVSFTAFINNFLNIKNNLLHLDKYLITDKLEFLKGYSVVFLKNAMKNERKLSKKDIILLLNEEFKNHPIFKRLDYKSMPIPLKNGSYIFLTKNEFNLVIENINYHLPYDNWYPSWNKLFILYDLSFSLKFRTDHTILNNKHEYKYTEEIITNLVKESTSYYSVVHPFLDEQKIKQFHDLKTYITSQYINVLSMRNEIEKSTDISILGKVAIYFDTIISSVHKIVVTFKPDIKMTK